MLKSQKFKSASGIFYANLWPKTNASESLSKLESVLILNVMILNLQRNPKLPKLKLFTDDDTDDDADDDDDDDTNADV